jgi:Fuc2NAc and GlcNAc transferase
MGWYATARLRRYAIRTSMLDVPNSRSSHTSVTPRGGGAAIAATVLLAVVLLGFSGALDPQIAIGMGGGGTAVALVGWFDDRGHVPVLWRALIHGAAAAWLVYWVDVPAELRAGSWSIDVGGAAPVLAVLGLVWLTNLFNFMDGIDGIAGVEAVSVASVGGTFLLVSGMRGLAAVSFVLGACTLGFLYWNWPPARIFMGDVGSGFLGFLLGGLAIVAAATDAVPLVVWLILLGVFIFDATVTLLRRIPRERVYTAHRRHAYQRAVAAGFSHRSVALAVLLLNAVLAVVASVVLAFPDSAVVSVLAVIGLLGVAYLAVERRRPMWGDRESAGPAPPPHRSVP